MQHCNNKLHAALTLTMFFAHFNTGTRHTAQLEPDHLELRPNRRKARSALRGVRNWKASGPDGVPERVLEACADQLAEVFREIFNLSLTEAIMPSCLKSKTTEPIPEQKHVSTGSLNDHRPVSLTLAIVKGWLWSTWNVPWVSCLHPVTLNLGIPHGCMLFPRLYAVFNHETVHVKNSIRWRWHNSRGLITNNDEEHSLQEHSILQKSTSIFLHTVYTVYRTLYSRSYIFADFHNWIFSFHFSLMCSFQ